ncbi:alpha/beta hydrolase [Nocardioides sp.]|uniref:alpha/beta hydrolase n=1 Tax=Nocardioides sp. TaxID=35761 RepID=UPI002B2786DA|nr:alpha/beta hydrolase [Nocardioides sp.]
MAAPGVLGNLAGIPARVRHHANHVRLHRDLAGLRSLRDRGLITDRERVLLRNAEAASAALDDASATTDPRSGEAVPALLYLYDPGAFGGDGAVALAVGDLDTADDVSVLVPGMRTDAAGIGGLTGHATAVYEAARQADDDATHASLAWIGYDAPDTVPLLDGLAGDVVRVLDEGLAEQGGARLAEAVDGLRAERAEQGGPPADLTVIGHSYGSTTVGHAASDHGLAVDDLVVVGSPGLGGEVRHVSDLEIGEADVWVGANSLDVVTDLGDHGAIGLSSVMGLNLGLGLGLGHDPAADDFGATRFQAESPIMSPGDVLDAHSGYFDHDGESLHNIARIVSGHDEWVSRADGVVDDWWRPPVDPERRRHPTTQITRATLGP